MSLYLFDRKFAAQVMKNLARCPQCRSEFSLNYDHGDKYVKSNRPVLLTCGHNMCENCVFQYYKNLECKVCLLPIQVHKKQFNLRDHFEMNFFLLGKLKMMHCLAKDVFNASSSTIKKPKSAKPREVCRECESATATNKCEQCNVVFCMPCFKKVHSHSKVMKDHEAIKLNTSDVTPQSPYCQRHKQFCYSFCSKCMKVCCSVCVKSVHIDHPIRKLFEENIKSRHMIADILEIIKESRETLHKSQKAIKAVETQLEVYAGETLESIGTFFGHIHSLLQLEERRIKESFRNLSVTPQQTLRLAFEELQSSDTIMDNMRTTLEKFDQDPPKNIHLQSVIDSYQIRLEALKSQVHVSDVKQNPFVFVASRSAPEDILREVRSYYQYSYTDPKITTSIASRYGDRNRLLNQSASTESYSCFEANHSNLKGKFVNSTQNLSCETIIISESGYKDLSAKPTDSMKANDQWDNRVVRVTHIISPEEFYICSKTAETEIRQISDSYVKPNYILHKSITEGHYYMVYSENSEMWYRGVVKTLISPTSYKIFLLDLGTEMDVVKENIIAIREESMTMPSTAIRCSLSDIMSPTQSWSKEAKKFMLELTQNKYFRTCVVENIKNDMLQLDLISATEKPHFSLRSAFLYTGLAIKRSVANNTTQSQSLHPVALLNERLLKQKLNDNEMMNIKVTHVVHPHEFYVVKSDQIPAKDAMLKALNEVGEKNKYKVVNLGALQLACIVLHEGYWQRVSIEDIGMGGKILVRFVDEGFTTTVDWYNLHALPKKYRDEREFAIRCSLANVETLQSNNYKWSEEAIKTFQHLCCNPLLQIAVVSSDITECKVYMHASNRSIDINFNLCLAKKGYCSAVGELDCIDSQSKSKAAVSEAYQQVADSLALQSGSPALPLRSTIKIVYVVNPAEFYVQLATLTSGVKAFFQAIAADRDKIKAFELDDSMSAPEWFVNDQCFVQIDPSSCKLRPIRDTLSKFKSGLDLFRGVIKSICHENEIEAPFTVFLRDFGLTVTRIQRHQLLKISPRWQAVTNAVQRCHLACLEPAADKSCWSSTATDAFKHQLKQYEALAATSHQRNHEKRLVSMPIVLWGSKTEMGDPLAPCKTQYANINRIMANTGTCRLVGELNESLQIESFFENSAQEGEINFQQWMQQFDEKMVLKTPLSVKEEVQQLETSVQIDNLVLGEAKPEKTMTFLTPSAWLSSIPIKKTLFNAIVTMVDYSGAIFLHEVDREPLLNQLRRELTNAYAISKYDLTDSYRPNQACVVKYHLDNHFYRGIIKRQNTNGEYTVRFIDYGNEETVDAGDLRPFAPFPDLPAQANSYLIKGIRPKGGETRWPTRSLDIIHKLMVEKMVAVRVSSDDLNKAVKRAAFRVDAMDVADYLCSQGIATRSGKANEPDILQNIQTVLSGLDEDETFTFQPEEVRNPITIADPEFDYEIKSEAHRMIGQEQRFKRRMLLFDPKLRKKDTDKNMDFMEKPQNAPAEEHNTLIHSQLAANDEDINELEQSFALNYWQCDQTNDSNEPLEWGEGAQEDEELGLEKTSEDINTEMLQLRAQIADVSTFNNFTPKRSSSAYTHFSGMDSFKPAHLPGFVNKFCCEVTCVMTWQIVHIIPMLTELRFRDTELERTIQSFAADAPPLEIYDHQTICLARYSKDKQWYRALIRNYTPGTELCTVLYVDYLNCEVLSTSELKQYPTVLMDWPLRTFAVRLSGIVPTQKIESASLTKLMRKLIYKKNVYAQIIRNGKTCGTTDLMEVELYNTKDYQELAYQQLITKKYFHSV